MATTKTKTKTQTPSERAVLAVEEKFGKPLKEVIFEVLQNKQKPCYLTFLAAELVEDLEEFAPGFIYDALRIQTNYLKAEGRVEELADPFDKHATKQYKAVDMSTGSKGGQIVPFPVQTPEEELFARLDDLRLRCQSDSLYGVAETCSKINALIKLRDYEKAQFECGEIIGNLRRHSDPKQRENGDRIKALFSQLVSADNLMVVNEQTELIECEIVDVDGLTVSDLDRLEQLEFAIQRGVESYVAAGLALVEIQESKLYRRFGTFEAYCQERWGFSRGRAYQLVEAAKVVDGLSKIVDKIPDKESQARALAKVPEDRRLAVWKAVLSDGKPTAKAIAAAAKAEPVDENWSSDDWETPDWLASYVVDLLGVDEHNILEPTAGTGQFVAQLERRKKRIVAVEIAQDRFDVGSERHPVAEWWHYDILNCNFDEKLDASVGNLPFSKAMPILDKVLNHLIKPDGRCLYVMPIDFFNAIGRAKALEDMGAIIYDRHPIVDRVPYLKHGQPVKGRQVYDCIFDIRRKPKGGINCGERLVWQPR